MKFRTLSATTAVLLCGCKIDWTASADSTATALGKKLCPDGSQMKGNTCPSSSTSTPTPTPTTTTTTTTTTTVVSPSLKGEADIADNFDTSTWIVPGRAHVTSPDECGAFRYTCLAGQL